MKKSVQNALFWTFCLAFLVLSPAVLLYTAGYRINLNNQRVRQNGALDIETTPRGATISWNGQNVNDRTPTVLNNLLPGEGQLTIAKAGYQPFSHPLTITSGRTSYVDIPLFPVATPTLLSQPEPIPANAPAHAPVFTREGTTVAVRLADGQEPIAWLPLDTYTVISAKEQVIFLAGQRQGGFALLVGNGGRTLPLPFAPTFVAPESARTPSLFLLSNGQEVQLFDLARESFTLITRQTAAISAIAWLENDFGYLVADETGITAYTRDIFADGRVLTRLVSGTPVTAMSTPRRGSVDYQTADGLWYRLPLL